MKPRPSLRVPPVLVFTLGSAAVTVAAISCGGDDDKTDAGMTCNIFCIENRTDGGVPPPDGGCPICADLTSGAPTCPGGCEPIG